jgi:hypothetical protein
MTREQVEAALEVERAILREVYAQQERVPWHLRRNIRETVEVCDERIAALKRIEAKLA